MNALLQEYLPLVIFIGVSLAIGLVLLIAPFIVAYRQPDPEKLSAYECGFNAFDDARMNSAQRTMLIRTWADHGQSPNRACKADRHRTLAPPKAMEGSILNLVRASGRFRPPSRSAPLERRPWTPTAFPIVAGDLSGV
jgi:hypothetical protein